MSYLMGTNDNYEPYIWAYHLSPCFSNQSYVLVQFREVSFSFRVPDQGEEHMFLHSVLKWIQNSRVSHHLILAASLVTAGLQKKTNLGKLPHVKQYRQRSAFKVWIQYRRRRIRMPGTGSVLGNTSHKVNVGRERKLVESGKTQLFKGAFQLWPVLTRT